MQISGADLGKAMTTHMGVLAKVIQTSEGCVIELGTGLASTPLLHWLCKDMDRFLISYENDQEFYTYAKQYMSRLHRIRFVSNWDQVDTSTHYGIVFIDHAPAERRGVDVLRFKNSADYIVMHDTDNQELYNYTKVWSYFKHTYTWKESRPWVSVVSNFKDLSVLKVK